MSLISKTGTCLVLLLGLLALSCAGPQENLGEAPVWRDADDNPIPEPRFEEPSLGWNSFKRTGPEQLRELLDLDRDIRKITGHPTQAKNTNSFDEVPNSSWFTNRHGYPATRMTPRQIRAGRQVTSGPDTSGSWMVFRPKLGGFTPGFWIQDARGDQYLLKFDPSAFPEMATAAAAMGSRYFYACGYNTAQETIVYWRTNILRIQEGATVKLADGTRRPLTMSDIETLLAHVHRDPDGTIRSLASLNLGNVKGPFLYDGVNKQDKNDWCPHQHRRELRALQVIGSLVNHYDLKDHNSMNIYTGEPGQGHLEHYLMDFGSTFGSDGFTPKIPRKGYANWFDLRDAFVNIVTAGIKTWAWEYAKAYRYPSIGYFESELFEPRTFDPIIPNPAFEQITNQDGYWGAKTVMAFDDAGLEALVEAGEYTNPEAARYLLETLKQRREKIGKYWFSRVNPIDYPNTSVSGTDLVIHFEDLWITSGLGEQANQEVVVQYQGKRVIDRRPVGGNAVHLDKDDQLRMQHMVDDCNEREGCGLFEILVYSTRDGRRWKMPVRFTLSWKASPARSRIVAIAHPS